MKKKSRRRKFYIICTYTVLENRVASACNSPSISIGCQRGLNQAFFTCLSYIYRRYLFIYLFFYRFTWEFEHGMVPIINNAFGTGSHGPPGFDKGWSEDGRVYIGDLLWIIPCISWRRQKQTWPKIKWRPDVCERFVFLCTFVCMYECVCVVCLLSDGA